ncbi:uncharacterized protein PRCAT00004614001 [Priceomyces carsonii]|uniref:uncharacterized protein n=1 Tax=Priceomyces carsonii TaxID=28549 RepID=UPI002EDB488C|nr:unnamed protein product [Priceomyces carsonii]
MIRDILLLRRSFFSRRFVRLSSRVPQTLSSNLVSNLFQKCSSCGIKLQSEDPKKPGFFIEWHKKKRLNRQEDRTFNKIISELPSEDRKLLLNNENVLTFDLTLPKKNELKIEDQESLPECIRCRNIKYRSNVDFDELPIHDFDNVLTSIPPNGNIVYVINCQDFPFSLNPSIFAYRRASDIKFIINKADLLFKRVELSNKYGSKFFKDYLHRKYHVPLDNVMVISGLINWNMSELLKFLDNESYLIGSVNSGKSTIIGAMLYHIHEMKPKYLSSREKTRAQKNEDKRMNKISMVGLLKTELKRQRLKEKNFRAKSGPGTSFMPGFTRDHIMYDLGDKFIYDVQGFTNLSDHGIYSIIDQKIIKYINKGSKVFKNGMFDSRYESVKGEQCLTIGGIFYLVPPKGAIYQIRNCINYKLKEFATFDKAIDRFSKIESYPALKHDFIVPKSTLKSLQKYIMPPFYGSIDLVIKGIGHINIRPTGKRANNLPAVIYLPRGVEALVRQPISEYVAKSLTGRDSNGNLLKKENWVSKSVTSLKSYNNSSPFSTRLIPIPYFSSSEQELYAAISNFVTLAKNKRVLYSSDTIFNESNRFDYWVED